jgi:hypothetical protein
MSVLQKPLQISSVPDEQCLFNDAVTKSDCVAPDDWMIIE